MKSIYGSFQYWNSLRSSECILLLQQVRILVTLFLTHSAKQQGRTGELLVTCVSTVIANAHSLYLHYNSFMKIPAIFYILREVHGF